ncbi:DUF2284 domain-containing protein [Clostridium cochlearium]|uniref:DUF2284 domain-containing protein n=1 Tax=Clostridium cochlearium TaxID=1494 RepID=UPI000BBC096F|nr:DUF2284 domain-containing protein [Clostridium cochlearium]MBU5270469.1 DUF2284 domain-containing protein [Clostridium cochlearium]
MLDLEVILEDIIKFGAQYAKSFELQDVEFDNKIRNYCKENLCGHYGTNWMCPPGVGEIEDLKKEVMKFKKGIIYQTIHPVKNIRDRKETDVIRDRHNNFTRELTENLREKYSNLEFFPMGAGPCELCTTCGYLKGEKCIYPQKSISSAEAYGINLGSLLKSCGLEFNYSDDTLAYVGVLLIK